jgi:hypothetical protein
MAEPYEPGRNARVRLHDASLYHGRYYLYFGVVPVVVLFAPWALLGGGDLPEALAAVLFAVAGYVFFALLLRHLVRRHLPKTPRWARLIAYALLGLSSVVPFALRGASVYEVALTAGYAFAGAAAWLLATAGERGPLSLARVAVAGLCLGLAVGCRPNHLLLLPLLPLLALPSWRASPERRRRAVLAFALPLGLCLLLLGTYNKARFDSWFDFGTRYALVGNRPVPWFDLRGIPPALWFQFLAPPDARLDFPFFFPATDYPGETPQGFYKEASVTGLLAHSPFVLFLLGAPWLLRRDGVREAASLRRTLAVLVTAGLLSPILTAFVFPAAAMRYQVDFASFLVVPAVAIGLLALLPAPGPWRRRLGALGLVACLWSGLLAVALSLSGSTDALRRRNPDLWATLERRAEPLRVGLGRLLDRDGRLVVSFRAAFPEQTAAAEEPLLSWGDVEESDVLWVEQRGPGVFAFSLDAASAREAATRPRQWTRGLLFQPGHFYDLDFDLDRVRRRVRARVDGESAFEIEGRLVPLHPHRLWLGRGPRGHGAVRLGHFSGTLIPEAMQIAGPPGLDTLPPIASFPAILTETKKSPPAPGDPGRLWVVAGARGAYISTQTRWRWIPRRFVERVRLERRLRLGGRTRGTRQPILFSGDESGADAVVIRHLGGRRVAFGLARWSDGWRFDTEGPALSVPEGPGTVTVVLDRPARRVSVVLEGQEVLRTSADLRPLDPSLLRVGSLPRGMAL